MDESPQLGQMFHLFMHAFADIPKLRSILKNVLLESNIGELCNFRQIAPRGGPHTKARQNVHFEISLMENGPRFISEIQKDGTAKLIYLPALGEKSEKFWRVKFDNNPNPLPPPFPAMPIFAATAPSPHPRAMGVFSLKRQRGSDAEVSLATEEDSVKLKKYAEMEKYAMTLENAVAKLTEENRELIVKMYYTSQNK